MKIRRSLPNHLRVQVLARDQYRCLMCGRDKDTVALQVDHVKPVAEGGTDELSNLATLCQQCNNGKSAFRFSDYRSMALLPENLILHFKFSIDDPAGDFERYNLFLYYKHTQNGLPTSGSFHHTWIITRSQFAQSTNPDALKLRVQHEQAIVFESKIRLGLAAEGMRLVINEEGVCKISG